MFDRANDKKYVKWAKKVKSRDEFTCQLCQRQDSYLNSHHMNSWDLFVNERYDLDNGVTLCYKCHDMFHNIYGRGKNTKYQFQEYRKTVELLRAIAKKTVLAKNIEPKK